MVLTSKSLLTRLSNAALWFIATGGGIGLSPMVPATIGSVVAVLLYAFLPIPENSPFLWVIIAACFGVGILVTRSFATLDCPDPRYVVWDEFVGMWVTCIGVAKTLPLLVGALLLFRLFDVIKPFPIRRLERLPTGVGIMADDLAAGIYANMVLQGAQAVLSWPLSG